MNNLQIIEPSNNNVFANLSYSFESTDASSNYQKKQIQQGNDSFTMSEFTSTYTKRTISKNISTSTQLSSDFSLPSISNNDLFNMNQLYSNQKQLALPYNQTNNQNTQNKQLSFDQNSNYLL